MDHDLEEGPAPRGYRAGPATPPNPDTDNRREADRHAVLIIYTEKGGETDTTVRVSGSMSGM